MAPRRTQSVQAVQKLEAEINAIYKKFMDKVPKKMSKHYQKVSRAVRSATKKATTTTSRAARQLQASVFRTANGATTFTRKHVVPTVKPYTDRAHRALEPHVRPVAAAVHKHVQPRYAAMERDFERYTHGTPKLQVAAAVALYALLAVWLLRTIVSWLTAKPTETLAQRTSRAFKSLPGVRGTVAKAPSDAVASIKKQVGKSDPKVEPLLELPPGGLDADSVMTELEDRAQNDFRYADGESKATGTIYMCGESHRDLLNDAYCMFSQANPLHADLFPSIRRMEAEVLAMTATLMGGGRNGVSTVCGAMTSSGSESIVSAMFASLSYTKESRGIAQPEIVIADSAHAAYYKAAKYAGARLVIVPVSTKTYRLTAAAVRPYITASTAVVVASAVSFPHGALDDVEGLAAVCKARNVCLHVDACLGGFVLPFMRSLGHPVPPFDFSVEGVTSMSIDTHKYGQAHKGTSVVLYRGADLRHAQFTAVTSWSGGLYVSPGIAGSRSGALVATAWAAMRHMGVQGYQDSTKDIMRAVEAFKGVVKREPELDIMGEPASTVVAFTSTKKTFNIHQLGDILSQKGWSFSHLIKPAGLHFCFTLQHAAGMEAMSADFAAACKELREVGKNGKAKVSEKVKMYGMASSSFNADNIHDVLLQYQDVMLSAET